MLPKSGEILQKVFLSWPLFFVCLDIGVMCTNVGGCMNSFALDFFLPVFQMCEFVCVRDFISVRNSNKGWKIKLLFQLYFLCRLKLCSRSSFYSVWRGTHMHMVECVETTTPCPLSSVSLLLRPPLSSIQSEQCWPILQPQFLW